jgi:hypothetical protein
MESAGQKEDLLRLYESESQGLIDEELLEEICILEELQLDFKEFYFSLSTTGAIIAYLHDQGELHYQLENGKLYYYKR